MCQLSWNKWPKAGETLFLGVSVIFLEEIMVPIGCFSEEEP